MLFDDSMNSLDIRHRRDHNYILGLNFHPQLAVHRNMVRHLKVMRNLIVKVKEPQESEYNLITDKHVIFSFFHFAIYLQLV